MISIIKAIYKAQDRLKWAWPGLIENLYKNGPGRNELAQPSWVVIRRQRPSCKLETGSRQDKTVLSAVWKSHKGHKYAMSAAEVSSV